MNEETPLFIHDCEHCKFLGHHVIPWQDRVWRGDYDLYWCNQGDNFPTVLARFGNDEQDFMSGIVVDMFERQPNHPLAEAYRRAEARGLSLKIGAK